MRSSGDRGVGFRIIITNLIGRKITRYSVVLGESPDGSEVGILIKKEIPP